MTDTSAQYSQRGILRYEWIFGRGFVSSGEPGVTEALAERVPWRDGMRVLDVGSGLGGADLLLHRRHGARVLGVDLEPTMVELARERAGAAAGEAVEFHQADVRRMTWPRGAFDVVWSRDTLLHIAEKDALFERFGDWLRSDGYLVLTDYARAPGEGSLEFERYVSDSGYSLLDLGSYERLLAGAGFREVRAEDRTAQFIAQTERELERLSHGKDEFLRRFTTEDFDYLARRWTLRVRACRAGDMRWGWLFARGRPEG